MTDMRGFGKTGLSYDCPHSMSTIFPLAIPRWTGAKRRRIIVSTARFLNCSSERVLSCGTANPTQVGNNGAFLLELLMLMNVLKD